MIMIMIIISMCVASIMSQLFKGICTYFMFMIFNPYSSTVYSNDIGLMMIITIVMIIYDLYFYRMDALLSCWLSIISVFKLRPLCSPVRTTSRWLLSLDPLPSWRPVIRVTLRLYVAYWSTMLMWSQRLMEEINRTGKRVVSGVHMLFDIVDIVVIVIVIILLLLCNALNWWRW